MFGPLRTAPLDSLLAALRPSIGALWPSIGTLRPSIGALWPALFPFGLFVAFTPLLSLISVSGVSGAGCEDPQ